MKSTKFLMIVIFMCSSIISCNSALSNDKQGNNNLVEIKGTIQEQGMTSYQYGTHTMSGYALKSSTVDLNKYLNVKVTVKGKKIEGYPIDGGPDFIDVEDIKIN